MRIVFAVFLALVTSQVLGQEVECFKKFNFDNTYAVIGVGPMSPKDGDSLEKYWFVLDNVEDLNQLKTDWVFREKARNLLEANSFHVYITKNKKIINAAGCIINPTFNNICVAGEWREFDLAMLRRLHKKHSLHYVTETKTFRTVTEWESYRDSARKERPFLFFIEPNLRYEGQFKVTADKTDKWPNPAVVIGQLKKDFRILDTSRVNVEYSLSEYNVKHPEKMQIDVYSSRELFDRYRSDSFHVGPWEPQQIKTTAYWRSL